MTTLALCGFSTVLNRTRLCGNPAAGTWMLHSQSVTLLPFPPIAPPPGARPLNTQAVNMAKSNAGLVPTNMQLLVPGGILFAPLHVNVSPRRKNGCK